MDWIGLWGYYHRDGIFDLTYMHAYVLLVYILRTIVVSFLYHGFL
jgi:hypothetical protein